MSVATFDLFPVTEKNLTAEEFLSLTEEERGKIRCVKIIPPRIGRRDFGGFKVTMKSPVYHVRLQKKNAHSE